MEPDTLKILTRFVKAVFYALTAVLVVVILYILWTLNYDVIFRYFGRILGGTWLTIQLVSLSVFIGFFIALPVAIMRVSHIPWLRHPAYGFIFFFRGTPLLVQLFFIYYGLAQVDLVRHTFLWPVFRDAYWCALIAFALNTGGYSAEILRGAIQAVPKGEVEAARAIGMSLVTAYRRIILPRAFRLAIPAYGNEIIFMLKGTALASTITLYELTGIARLVNARTYQPVEAYLSAGVLYMVLTYIFLQAWQLFERRANRYLAAQG